MAPCHKNTLRWLLIMLNFSKGQLVSNKKEELLSILDNFNIQVFAKQNFSVQTLMQQYEIIVCAMSLCWYEVVIYLFFSR